MTDEIGAKWIDRIKAAEKRDDNDGWTKAAERAEVAYSGKVGKGNSDSRGKRYALNLLHSNVETIVPAIYNSSPTPDIRDRFGTGDEIAKAVADVFERVIQCETDDSALDCEIEKEAQDGFISGRGIVRLRFEADVTEEVTELLADGVEIVTQESQVTGERIYFEVVSWKDFRMGQARRWEHVPWVAFRHHLPKDEMERIAGDAAPAYECEDDKDVAIWEVWDKEARKVYFIRHDDCAVLSETDDPLGLEDFFPCPSPFQPLTIAGDLKPVVPFEVYRELADTVDTTTKRIHKITEGMKVRGAVAGSAENITRFSEAGDNEIVTLADLEQLAQTGRLDQAIMWWPIDTAASVLQQLYQARELAKQEIYEVTGISDIVRGASQASETATAQQIKNQWGSLRVRKMQRMLERQVREIYVMMVEIIANHYSNETIAAKAGMDLNGWTDEQWALLRNPFERYRIDVESDSTVRSNTDRIKGELSEFLNGTAQYMQTMAPLVAQSPQAIEPLLNLYAVFARQFNLGQQGEAAIDQLIALGKAAGQEKPEDPQAKQAEMQAQIEQAKMQLEQAKIQMEAQKLQGEAAIKAKELSIKEGEARERAAVDRERVEIEAGRTAGEMDIRRRELALKEREVAVKEQQARLSERSGDRDFSMRIAEREDRKAEMAEEDDD